MYPLLQSQASISILIVEDSRGANKIIGRMVSMQFPNAVVYSADNGITGLELFKKHEPEVVLTDINMPEMDGFQMAVEIRSIKIDTKFIVFTAYNDGDLLKQFNEIGVHTYLLKPYDLDELMMAIENCIDLHPPQVQAV